ncbi:7,8-didemethyl-8-hydroxy-5-deazariboflavin synthase subunit CofG [Okeania sp.]|uniref:7,8-didemethyl-8-hydroxy-5-deazariboflavin synthase subunit CofG n=1 Tax=Okeania sp. TaxID=3100323 RepID=UPI002B4B1FE2|nr:7,8-didemethyl-8-hydroxy-5-deazariboflavin synthase subunit CofG [Okeania sp.]MEB3339454.1 7,8-didemethyl-8-hydroxy-5-deazariboflavin synthase subunit CofG [Okeania sp.]
MSKIVTYSPAYTVVPTYECFNRCNYCNFRSEPGQSSWLSLSEAEKILLSLKNQGIIEILILSGEVHPNSQYRQAWFQLIYDLCKLALSLGFLPHTNVGPLSQPEMKDLKQVNVSMGLMLEQITPKLLETVHRNAPSKRPHLRLQQLEWAGELRIPFTTGLLLGIGETVTDWKETLEAIANIHQKWGHIQEVILQPYSPGNLEIWNGEGFELNLLPEVVAIARQILPSDITLQIPPNLVTKPEILLACLENGAGDLGGIGPLDEVNPDYPHLHYQALVKVLEFEGWELIKRLPVYSQYDNWLPINLKNIVSKWRSKLSVKLSPVQSEL